MSNNVLVIAGFSQPSVSRSVLRRLGVFYRLIAAFDIWVLLMKDFAAYWLEDGLALTTGGRISLATRTRSSFWYFKAFCILCILIYAYAAPNSCYKTHNATFIRCKSIFATWRAGIICADYTLASVSIERALAVCYPFWVRPLLSSNWVSIEDKLTAVEYTNSLLMCSPRAS